MQEPQSPEPAKSGSTASPDSISPPAVRTPRSRTSARSHLRSRTEDLPRVEILWEDAAVDPCFDGKLEDLTSGTVLNRTIGYLAREDKHEVRLVRDITDADNTVRWPYSIPKRLIRKRTILKEAT